MNSSKLQWQEQRRPLEAPLPGPAQQPREELWGQALRLQVTMLQAHGPRMADALPPGHAAVPARK